MLTATEAAANEDIMATVDIGDTSSELESPLASLKSAVFRYVKLCQQCS